MYLIRLTTTIQSTQCGTWARNCYIRRAYVFLAMTAGISGGSRSAYKLGLHEHASQHIRLNEGSNEKDLHWGDGGSRTGVSGEGGERSLSALEEQCE